MIGKFNEIEHKNIVTKKKKRTVCYWEEVTFRVYVKNLLSVVAIIIFIF